VECLLNAGTQQTGMSLDTAIFAIRENRYNISNARSPPLQTIITPQPIIRYS
jgi:hypothetical protein